MRTLNEIRQSYSLSGIDSLPDSELLRLFGIRLCDGSSVVELLRTDDTLLRQRDDITGQALELIAAIREVIRRVNVATVPKDASIRSSKDVTDLMKPLLKDLDHEEVWVLYLNTAAAVIGRRKICSGTVNTCTVDIRGILVRALSLNATSLILVHNHPSGNNSPSKADIVQTKALSKAAKAVGLTLLDHVIITPDKDLSFVDSGTELS